jgi:hypothetical protein
MDRCKAEMVRVREEKRRRKKIKKETVACCGTVQPIDD